MACCFCEKTPDLAHSYTKRQPPALGSADSLLAGLSFFIVSVNRSEHFHSCLSNYG